MPETRLKTGRLVHAREKSWLSSRSEHSDHSDHSDSANGKSHYFQSPFNRPGSRGKSIRDGQPFFFCPNKLSPKIFEKNLNKSLYLTHSSIKAVVETLKSQSNGLHVRVLKNMFLEHYASLKFIFQTKKNRLPSLVSFLNLFVFIKFRWSKRQS